MQVPNDGRADASAEHEQFETRRVGQRLQVYEMRTVHAQEVVSGQAPETPRYYPDDVHARLSNVLANNCMQPLLSFANLQIHRLKFQGIRLSVLPKVSLSQT